MLEAYVIIVKVVGHDILCCREMIHDFGAGVAYCRAGLLFLLMDLTDLLQALFSL